MKKPQVCDICGKKIGQSDYIEINTRVKGSALTVRRHYACHAKWLAKQREGAHQFALEGYHNVGPEV